jgi:ribonuclease-3
MDQCTVNKLPQSYMRDGIYINKSDGSVEHLTIPYNATNILINENDVIQILNNHNVKVSKIHKLHFFHEAFTHKSYLKNKHFTGEILEKSKKELGYPSNLLDLREKSYERLEYLGDRVIKIIISTYLFTRYHSQQEGFLTKLQSKVEDKKNLPIMACELGLNKFLILSNQIEQNNGRHSDKFLEDCFESFFGALFLSNGFEPCTLLMINLLETCIDFSSKLYYDNNYKAQLLEHFHALKNKSPKYFMIHSEGPQNKKIFIMGVQKNDASDNDPLQQRGFAYGKGSTKKEGEQNAAKMALIIEEVLNDDQHCNSDLFYPDWENIKNAAIQLEEATDNKIKQTNELSDESDSDYD